MSKKEEALEFFRQGYNCAQAVLLPFSGDNELFTKIASGFGGGIARMQQTCGALTGAAMVAGLRYAAAGRPDEESKSKVYAVIQSLDKEFIKLHGSDQCIDLLGTDMNSDEGKRIIKEKKLHDVVCEKCIVTVIDLLEKGNI